MLRMKADTRVLDWATPSKRQLLVRLLHGREVHAFGKLLHDLVEQMHDLRTRALQLLDDLHAAR